MNIDYAAILLIFLVATFLGAVMIVMTTYLGPKASALLTARHSITR
jgi:hypothetical protein